MGPVARSLHRLGLAPRLFLTGQHPDLAPGDFGFPPCGPVQLNCRGGGDPCAHAERVAERLLPRLGGIALLVVQGDTSSALGGALAAERASVPLAHVEAGLRSHDRRNPWPEEMFRVRIDRLSALLFAPTELSAANLRREQLPGTICVTGNSGIDAALARHEPHPVRPAGGPARLLVTCHRRESWGPGLETVAAAIRQIGSEGAAIRFVLHPNPAVGARMRRLLCGSPGIRLVEPCSQTEMLALMRRSDLILSDSGGMQEEAPLLGIPLLVLRDRTERPEAIATGNAILVGTDTDRITAAVRTLIANPRLLERMARPALPFGGAGAADRIAAHLVSWQKLERPVRAA